MLSGGRGLPGTRPSRPGSVIRASDRLRLLSVGSVMRQGGEKPGGAEGPRGGTAGRGDGFHQPVAAGRAARTVPDE